MDLHITGPSKIERCDKFLNISAPLIHVKLLEHLHCLTRVCHCGAFNRVINIILVGFVAISIDFVYGKILSNFRV